ncbi:NUDIX domain-containing protein [Photorhabdus luminescens]|uniref:8-oxo-dGTP diphosphatase n=2 Tax=Photorhabdus TaxID=29487 RepID=A0A022PIQ9_9GAMM|nr:MULTISPECIES: NUDIX domain-containing protein [Photorhabdus]EYU15404.1 NTP pyrophosphohydrolase [Photorhabdus aegyptia]MCC8459226.1 NUDIX domain-containing protein [Photorhabdus aegyptia]QXF31923.1 NUDIX domain-containing protein [Photorhabdus akhurstii]UJD73717.1 NUDIX domain-containing protein [Photorhabdus luminescens]
MMCILPESIENTLQNYDRIVVGGIIRDQNGNILFLQRAPDESPPNLWEIPSGGVEKGENLLQALSREIEEETGLLLDDVIGFLSAVEYSIKEARCLQVNFNVKCTGEVKLSPEHAQYQWSNIANFRSELDDFMLRVLNEA